MDEQQLTLGYGLCECGCGEKVRAAKYPSWQTRFVAGHRARLQATGPEYREEDRGYETPCWVWQRATATANGYGSGRHADGRRDLAHRVVWMRHNGPIPDGLHLDHLCRVRACVNPDHLEPVTCAENIHRGSRTKLTAEQVADIRASDVGPCELGRLYGVNESAIRAVRTGKNW